MATELSKKAYMKWARSVCGVSQRELADAVGVRVLTVKRWERSDESEPPDDALGWLARAVEAHGRDVAELVETCERGATRGDHVFLDWYLDQEQADLAGQGVPYGYANAVARDAAQRLAADGYRVVIRYPDEEIVGLRER